MTRVLVAYASKHGSTAEIAQAVAETLGEAGLSVDCVEAGAVGGIDAYDAVVLGSAVYMKRWQGDARHFLRTHGTELSQRPFWVFSSGPIGDPAHDNPSWEEPRRTIEKAEALGVREHVIFGGRIPTDPHGPAQRGMVKNTPAEYRDRRDWDEIRGWASRIAAELTAAVPIG
ncbi:MAG: flavodoxin domain-containing protein [Solirubrobacteraceae bacterium]